MQPNRRNDCLIKDDFAILPEPSQVLHENLAAFHLDSLVEVVAVGPGIPDLVGTVEVRCS